MPVCVYMCMVCARFIFVLIFFLDGAARVIPLPSFLRFICSPPSSGVERSVDFLMSPRLGQAYQHLKEHGSNLPLVGRAVFLPSVEAAEGATRFFLVVVQAPLPSAESVANVAEVIVGGN